MSRFTDHLIKRLQRSAGLQATGEKEWMQFARSPASRTKQRFSNKHMHGRRHGSHSIKPGTSMALNLRSCYPLKNVQYVVVGKTTTKKESYLSSRKRRSLVYRWTLGSSESISIGKWKQELQTVTRNEILYSETRGGFVTSHNSRFRSSPRRHR